MAAPAEPIGATVQVVNLVTGEIEREKRTLATGDKVHRDESIEVGPDAVSEIKLDDDTKLALGPGSRLKLDKFVYDPGNATGSIVMKMAKGTFRFVTGLAKKPAYRILTPTAAITVRGTIFDLFVEESGRTWLLLHEGAVEVCNTRGRCRQLDEPGKLILVSDEGQVGPPAKWAGLDGKGATPFDTAFPFVTKPPQIDPSPVLSRDVIIQGNLLPGKAGDDEDEDKPRRTKKPKHDDEETKSPPRKADKTDEPKKETKERTKPKKEASKPAKTKPIKSSKADDEAIAKGAAIAIGVGLAIGGTKIGGGGKGKHPKGDGPTRGSGTKYPGTKSPGMKESGVKTPGKVTTVKKGSGMSSMSKKGFTSGDIPK